MTVDKLAKILTEMQRRGLGRRNVVVDKESLWDGNQCWQMCSLGCAYDTMIYISDDDGGIATTKRGRERDTLCVVLSGNEKPPKEPT